VREVDGSDEIRKNTHTHTHTSSHSKHRWPGLKKAAFLSALNPLFQMTWREKSSVVRSVIVTEWGVQRFRLPFFFYFYRSLKSGACSTLCAFKSDLSYQTNIACVWNSESVGVGLCISPTHSVCYVLCVCVCVCVACSHTLTAVYY